MRSKLYVCVLAVMCSLMLCACGQKEAEKEKSSVWKLQLWRVKPAKHLHPHPYKSPVPWLPV